MNTVNIPNYSSKYRNKTNNRPSFGMSFIRCTIDNYEHVRTGFGEGKIANFAYKKALSLVAHKCRKHKNFAIMITEDGLGVRIISLTNIGRIKLTQKYGNKIIVLDNNCVYPNFAQRVDNDLKKIKEKLKPNNFIENFFFNVYGYVHRQLANLYVATHPYEKLPPYFRKGVDIMIELEEDLKPKQLTQ